MRGAAAAQIDGVFERYHPAMYKAMWVDGRNLNDIKEVAAVLTAAGLDARKFGNRIQDQDVKDRLKSTTDEAVARGVFGAPTSVRGRHDVLRQRPPAVRRDGPEGRAQMTRLGLLASPPAVLFADARRSPRPSAPARAAVGAARAPSPPGCCSISAAPCSSPSQADDRRGGGDGQGAAVDQGVPGRPDRQARRQELQRPSSRRRARRRSPAS